jgi:hypothetical protein
VNIPVFSNFKGKSSLMKKNYFWGVFTLLVLISTGSYAQWIEKKGVPVICYGKAENANTVIKQPESFYKANSNQKTAANSVFKVKYIGFTEDSKAAFQKAVDIWSLYIKSPKTINIKATWKSLAPGVLGSAGASSYFAKFEGALKDSTFYSIALVEKLTGEDYNEPDSAEIIANFNSDAAWYLGLDGNCPNGVTDFVSVVLHEIGHGLGMASSMGVEGTLGGYGLGSNSYKTAYDSYISNSLNQFLTNLNTFANPSTQLKSQMTGKDLIFNGPFIKQFYFSDTKIYAPSSFNQGSSISHVDENTFGSGDPNSLMTPFIAQSEVIHKPGNIMMGILSEIGWLTTYIKHTPIKDTEAAVSSIQVKANIYSDTTLRKDSIFLYYSNQSFSQGVTKVAMTRTGTGNEYTAQINTSQNKYVNYYIAATDTLKRRYTYPSLAPTYFNQFFVGPDTVKPKISHTGLDFILTTEDTLTLLAEITDNIAVDTAYVEYLINDAAKSPVGLKKIKTDSYKGNIHFAAGTLNAGDLIRYRIVAIDSSSNKNKRYFPSTGYTVIPVEAVSAPVAEYVNNFNSVSNDFKGNMFSISQPAGFTDNALHSPHPYENGPKDYIHLLKIPVIIKETDANITFDEVVLVEPGEPGSVFGLESFYDYVVVEGSKNGGATWKPLADGYDSRAQAVWEQKYNSAGSGQNSTATGNASLFRTRQINFLDRFAAKDTIIIRFRLFADPGAYGWGWAIDNIRIQTVVTANEPDFIAEQGLRIYPNPASSEFIISGHLKYQSKNVTLALQDVTGRVIKSAPIENAGLEFTHHLNVSDCKPGFYLVQLSNGVSKTTRKVLITR